MQRELILLNGALQLGDLLLEARYAATWPPSGEAVKQLLEERRIRKMAEARNHVVEERLVVRPIGVVSKEHDEETFEAPEAALERLDLTFFVAHCAPRDAGLCHDELCRARIMIKRRCSANPAAELLNHRVDDFAQFLFLTLGRDRLPKWITSACIGTEGR